VPREDAIALGLLLYLLNVAVSLLGAPAFAAGGRARSAPDQAAAGSTMAA
jgi:glycosyltransferase 2 family protein